MNKPIFLIFCLGIIVFNNGCSSDSSSSPLSPQSSLPFRDSLSAPGCIKSSSMDGGCFGKTVINNLKVEPNIECLEIGTNNCNGGILDITNQCPRDLVIGGETIKSGESYVGLDLKDDNGKFILIRTEGNHASFVPNKTKSYEIQGSIGGDILVITFQKTEKLCN